MVGNLPKILALNPGSRYLGFSFFFGPDLRDWGVKVIPGRWSEGKLERVKSLVSKLIEEYQPNCLALKRLHPSRSSLQLKQLVRIVKALTKRKRLELCQFTIEELKTSFSLERANKRELAEKIATHYPVLFAELEKEKRAKNPYRIRMFEAVALGSSCFQQLDSEMRKGQLGV